MSKLKIEINAAKKLVAAIITQAIEDYRSMESKGWILGGQIILPKKAQMSRASVSKKTRGILARRTNCEEIIHFFKPGGMMDKWIDVGMLDINPNQIRRKLGIPSPYQTKN
jgi:hypothetical protein